MGTFTKHEKTAFFYSSNRGLPANHFLLTLFQPTEQGSKNEEVSFERTPMGWVKQDPDKSDFALFHPEKKSMIIVNSLCRKYESTSLRHLNSNLLGGLEDVTIQNQKKMMFKGRDSLRTELRGKLDGVPIWLFTQTVKKNFCVYDFVLIAPNLDSYKDSTLTSSLS